MYHTLDVDKSSTQSTETPFSPAFHGARVLGLGETAMRAAADASHAALQDGLARQDEGTKRLAAAVTQPPQHTPSGNRGRREKTECAGQSRSLLVSAAFHLWWRFFKI